MKYKSYLAIITAGILWGIISLFVRKLNTYGLDAIQISAIRCIFTAVILLIFTLLKNPTDLKIKLKDMWCFAGTGIVSLTFFNYCYFYTIAHSQASIAVVLLYTSPIFVMLFSALIFKERITIKKFAALILCFTGCVLVSGIFNDTISISQRIMLLGISSGLFYALYSIFGIFALRKYNTLTVSCYTFFFAGFINLFTCRPFKIYETVCETPSILIIFLEISVLSTLLPYFLYTYGLKKTSAGTASMLVTTEPLTGALIGICIYNEPYDMLKIAGILSIFAAVILLSVKSFRIHTHA